MSQDVSSAIRIIYGVLFLFHAPVQDHGLCLGSQPLRCADGALKHAVDNASLIACAFMLCLEVVLCQALQQICGHHGECQGQSVIAEHIYSSYSIVHSCRRLRKRSERGRAGQQG